MGNKEKEEERSGWEVPRKRCVPLDVCFFSFFLFLMYMYKVCKETVIKRTWRQQCEKERVRLEREKSGLWTIECRIWLCTQPSVRGALNPFKFRTIALFLKSFRAECFLHPDEQEERHCGWKRSAGGRALCLLRKATLSNWGHVYTMVIVEFHSFHDGRHFNTWRIIPQTCNIRLLPGIDVDVITAHTFPMIDERTPSIREVLVDFVW